MAFLQIKSSNPNFSYVMKKNPSAGMQVKSMRKGVAFGYYSDDQTYNIFFKDADNEISYPESKDQEFEYINTTRYSSSLFVINAISEFARDTLKKRSEQDADGFLNSVAVNMMPMRKQKILAAFRNHFKDDCRIEAQDVSKGHCRVEFSAEKSLYYLLNVVNLFSCFMAMENDSEYLQLDPPVIEKYLQSLQVVDAPYFIRYSFKYRLLRGDSLFQKHKNLLEASSRYPIQMVFGDTLRMRIDWVLDKMPKDGAIVDVGCGEGVYVSAFKGHGRRGKDFKTAAYAAIDIDPDARESVKRRVSLKNFENVQVFDSLSSFLLDDSAAYRCKLNFLMTEVVEHMDLANASNIVEACLNDPRFNCLILTTPNCDFNKHYFEDDLQMRHPGHEFEFSQSGFLAWLEIFKDARVEFFPIGDCVNGEPTTLGAVLTKKGAANV